MNPGGPSGMSVPMPAISGLLAAQQRIADIQNRFAQPASFAAGLARAEQAMVRAARGTGTAGAAWSTAGTGTTGAAAGAGVPWRPSPEAPIAGPVSQTAPISRTPTASPSEATGDWVSRLPAQGRRWVAAIRSAAGAAGIDPALLASLVQAESGFRADARSHAGAVGLGQLMPATARALGVDPNDPVQNLHGAARYLRQQLDRFGSVELALAAYNAGPGRVAQAGGIPRIAETRDYVARVVTRYDELRSS